MGPDVIFEEMTLARFLRLPETKPALEYIDGKVVRKVSPKRTHSVLDTDMATSLRNFSRGKRLGRPYIELRCTFDGRSLVPDLCFLAQGKIPRGPDRKLIEDVLFAPDFVIEIISPGQTVKNLLARLNWCVAHGVRLAWLVQPTKRRVFVVRPGREREVLEGEAVLSGEDVLPGYTLPLAEMFGWLDED